MNEPGRGAISLAVAVLIALVALMLLNQLTKDRIEQARQQMMLDNLSAVLPEGPFDQNPIESRTEHKAQPLGGEQPLSLYTAYRNEQPVAAVLELLAPDGYSGDIRLLLGLHANGEIIAVRVIAHKETPGLGDRIEYRKSKWITQFDGQSITASEPADWQVRLSGGQYDTLSGATITSRAVIQAIHRALAWYELHGEEIFAK